MSHITLMNNLQKFNADRCYQYRKFWLHSEWPLGNKGLLSNTYATLEVEISNVLRKSVPLFKIYYFQFYRYQYWLLPNFLIAKSHVLWLLMTSQLYVNCHYTSCHSKIIYFPRPDSLIVKTSFHLIKCLILVWISPLLDIAKLPEA